jgi:hypothetical protein
LNFRHDGSERYVDPEPFLRYWELREDGAGWPALIVASE